MIPRSTRDLDDLAREAERQAREVCELVRAHPAETLRRRPRGGKWSAVGHLAHLCIVNEAYVEALRARIERARSRGERTGDGPFCHPLLARWFVRSMEPPPRRRLKTMKAMVPDPAVDHEDVVGRFAELQGQLGALLDAARGLDLGRIRFGSPFASLVRLSLGAGFELVLAHNRRHIWLIREVLAHEGAPGGGPAAA